VVGLATATWFAVPVTEVTVPPPPVDEMVTVLPDPVVVIPEPPRMFITASSVVAVPELVTNSIDETTGVVLPLLNPACEITHLPDYILSNSFFFIRIDRFSSFFSIILSC